MSILVLSNIAVFTERFRLLVLVIILLSNGIIIAQNEQVCMFNGDTSIYEIIKEKEFWHKRVNKDGTIIRKMSHLLHYEEQIYEEFDLRVNVEWIDDSKRPNAKATNKVTDAFQGDGTIYLGKSLTEVSTNSRYILMHEVGHIYDFKYGFSFSGKQGEYFADYFAGFVLGYDSGITILNDIDAIIFGFKTEEEVLAQKEKRKREAIMVQFDFWGKRDIEPNNHLKATSEERAKVLGKGYALGYNELYNIHEYMDELYAKKFSENSINLELNKRFSNYKINLTGYKKIELKPSITSIKESFEKDIKKLSLKS